MINPTITGIPGLLAGHATDTANHTGCTVIVCPEGFTPGLAVPGSAPGSRETELLRPDSLVDSLHGLALSGGSAFGLAAGDGVMHFLAEKGYGFAMPHGTVPIVSGAVIYDLDMNPKAAAVPYAALGYAAARSASGAPLPRGSVGAGTGARCGRLFGMRPGHDHTQKAGLGSSLLSWEGILVGALVVVNALGNVHDPVNGAFLAGGRNSAGQPFSRDTLYRTLAEEGIPRSNTVLAVAATNCPLEKAAVSRFARMAATGLARAIRPAHLPYDGDLVFALSSQKPLPSGRGAGTESLLGALGAEAVALAAADAVDRPGATKDTR